MAMDAILFDLRRKGISEVGWTIETEQSCHMRSKDGRTVSFAAPAPLEPQIKGAHGRIRFGLHVRVSRDSSRPPAWTADEIDVLRSQAKKFFWVFIVPAIVAVPEGFDADGAAEFEVHYRGGVRLIPLG